MPEALGAMMLSCGGTRVLAVAGAASSVARA